MRPQRLLLTISAVASATLWVYACGDGTTEPPAPDPLLPTTVTVSPATATVVEGDTLRLTATATNVYGQAVTGVEFVWASGDTAVAVVDASGLVTGVAAGQVQVTATAAGLTGRAELAVVTPLPTTIAVTPDTVVLTAVGQTAQLTAEVRDQLGRVMDGVPVAWLSAETTVAAVDASGLVTAVGGGAVTVTATAGEVFGDALVTVAINPDRAALVALYNATDGPNWVDNENWLTDAPLGEWYGVDTDRQGWVVRLLLPKNNLSGEIPAELGGLSNLEGLYLKSNHLTGEIPPELGSLSNLRRLDLGFNHLTGETPPELGSLSNLRWLSFGWNDITGEIPPELGELSNLEYLSYDGAGISGVVPQSLLNLSLRVFDFYCGPALACVPGTSVFVEWLHGIEIWDGPFCNASDHASLSDLYELWGGDEWTESTGWLSGPALEEWHGVETDSLGRVTSLVLSDNGLSGSLPGAIGSLGVLTSLRVDGNDLGGRLPIGLTALDLDEFHYDGTDLCEPDDAEFQTWLAGIPSHQGTSVQCPPLTQREALVALYEGMGGPSWRNSGGWLTNARLGSWHGVDVDSQGQVVGLNLSGNNLSGTLPPELGALSNLRSVRLYSNDLTGEIPTWLGGLSNLQSLDLSSTGLYGQIPAELGGLSSLRTLSLFGNELTGEIPPELGDLSNLGYLNLSSNELTGEIPPELGSLSSLRTLSLSSNELTGEIPQELGGLSNLQSLDLSSTGLYGQIPAELGGLSSLRTLSLFGNELTGEIPPELGGLSNLGYLNLAQNELSGFIPPELGSLSSLNDLQLSHNAGLAGAVPAGLINAELETLLASGTDLCVPRKPEFEEWLATIAKHWIRPCGEPPVAYLVQAVQSLAYPVPLVAGEDALLRVFVTAATETTEGMPEVRARFYVNGVERHVAEIAGSSTPIPTAIDEGQLSKSANVAVPGSIVRPGLEMVVEVDPDGTLDPSLGVPRRIPEQGRMAIEVRELPVLNLTVVPFLWDSDPDSAIIGLVDGMAADSEGHALLEETHVLLPVADIDVTAHAPVVSTSHNAYDLLRQTEALRVLEGSGGHYMGMMRSVSGAGGVAHRPGRSSFSQPYSDVIAHELGHNMSLSHGPCGHGNLLPRGSDPSFPDPRGAIGAWGYDFRRAAVVPRTRWDHMTYCDPTWTSDYHFTNALRHRLADEGVAAYAAPAARSLLLWGGVDTTGTPFLDPAFVADAPPALPDSAGDYTVTGRDASGRDLFSFSFAMPVALSAEAEVSSFAFALPVQPGWADALASITLSGPSGTATLDGDSDIPMAILRDPRTGQVRGILRDPPLAVEVAADAVEVSAQGLEVLFSRGIPGAAGWRR